jgi:LmbE family N-acetylglucosaminyl deacetylase
MVSAIGGNRSSRTPARISVAVSVIAKLLGNLRKPDGRALQRAITRVAARTSPEVRTHDTQTPSTRPTDHDATLTLACFLKGWAYAELRAA